MHLIDPAGYKKIIYDALQKMSNLDLIKYIEYDNKEFMLLKDENGEFIEHKLSDEEKLALININLLKTEVSYMCRYDTPNGGVQFELAREKRNVLHDDRSYTAAMAAYALSQMRRKQIVNIPINSQLDLTTYKNLVRKAKIYKH